MHDILTPETTRPSLFMRVLRRLAGLGLVNWVIICIFLLIGVPVSAFWLSFLWPSHREQQAVTEIERLGGTADYEKTLSPYKPKIRDLPFKRVRSINFTDTEVTDADLQRVMEMADFEYMEGIALESTRITGAALKHLRHLPGLSYVYLANTQVDDEGLKQLSEFRSPMILDLSNTRISDSGLEHLRGERCPSVLKLNRTRIGDAGIAHLRGNKNLWRLSLFDTQVGDDTLETIRECRLGYLDFGKTKITDRGLEQLPGHDRLDFLNVGDTEVSDVGLEPISKLTSLQILGLHGTRISDSGLEHVGKLTNLTELWLMKTSITDQGLEHLHGLSNLGFLGVEETQVTAEGLERLLESLPDCEIRWTPPEQ